MSNQSGPLERKYTAEYVADLAGVCAATVLRAIRAGKLKAIRLGKGWRISESEARRFLEGGCQ
jgi:excisionase family DNA binding protein